MALSETQRAQIRLYLGWSERFHQTDTALERAMGAIDTRPEATTLALAELAVCVDIDVRLTDALKRIKAMKVGSITLTGPLEIGLLRSKGRQAAGRIASIMGVDVRHDAFAGSGPRNQASTWGPVPGEAAGGSILHG